MLKIKGYQLNDNPVYKGKRSIIYRGLRITDDQAVIIKTSINEFPSIKEINRLQREFKIGQEITHKNVIRYFALEKHGHGWAIITEDFGAVSLAEMIPASGFDPASFLKIALQIVEAVGEIHKLEIVHKDLNPRNILIGDRSLEIRLIDFGISSHLKEEPAFQANLNNIDGNLAYISPEQTGRMNRGVDFRADFYSLGVTFYEAITGRLPFNESEPLELVYNHIAKTPLSPFEIQEIIPQPISNIVMKLLRKNAEDRYQSAYGLKCDLAECLRQLETSGKIVNFPIGVKDLYGSFQIQQKLYGRDSEIQQLMESFEQVSHGEANSILTLVAGYSGIGKSSLIHELYKPLAQKNGYFISGKFDQFRRNIPYASIIQAFQQLVKIILTESKKKISYWKDELLEALGPNGQVIIDVIPEVEYITGPQPAVPVLVLTLINNETYDILSHDTL